MESIIVENGGCLKQNIMGIWIDTITQLDWQIFLCSAFLAGTVSNHIKRFSKQNNLKPFSHQYDHFKKQQIKNLPCTHLPSAFLSSYS